MSAMTDEIPFVMFGNRRCLMDRQIKEFPWLAAFLARFKDAFERDELRSLYILREEEAAE